MPLITKLTFRLPLRHYQVTTPRTTLIKRSKLPSGVLRCFFFFFIFLLCKRMFFAAESPTPSQYPPRGSSYEEPQNCSWLRETGDRRAQEKARQRRRQKVTAAAAAAAAEKAARIQAENIMSGGQIMKIAQSTLSRAHAVSPKGHTLSRSLI